MMQALCAARCDVLSVCLHAVGTTGMMRLTYIAQYHSQEPLDYDSSEKRRVPAWTDRILFRGSQARQTSAPVRPSQPTAASSIMHMPSCVNQSPFGATSILCVVRCFPSSVMERKSFNMWAVHEPLAGTPGVLYDS